MENVRDFIIVMEAALEVQTNWGKVQVKDLMQRAYTKILEAKLRNLENKEK